MLVRAAANGQPNSFLTLTVNPNDEDYPADRARRMVIAFRELVRRIKKTYRYERFDYFAVMEATKRGEPHMHVLLRANGRLTDCLDTPARLREDASPGMRSTQIPPRRLTAARTMSHNTEVGRNG